MERKEQILYNKGMNRDTSVSKTDASSAYENFNIRINATDHDTLMSVANERGTKQISLDMRIEGDLIGWNVLNNHIVLFTHASNGTDYIYCVDKKGEDYTCSLLYSGKLGFSTDAPIESIVHFETDAIQKIYWLDGVNPLRMMNIVADDKERSYWDDTYFDANRIADFGVKVSITKDNSGNTRPNGVVQYLLTYYNKHAQETGYIWVSDLVYLSPRGIGGSADGVNSNKVTLTISNLDTRFTNFRIYSIFRSSYDGQVVANIVSDDKTDYDQESISVIDDYSHYIPIDPTQLLYLGSQPVTFETMTEKDNVLFLGNIRYKNRGEALTRFGEIIRKEMINSPSGDFDWGRDWESKCIEFVHSSITNPDIPNISIESFDYGYHKDFQLEASSSQITGFKGGEKYRFGLVFRDANGISSDVFWIGDKENDKYPMISGNFINRVVVKCTIPESVINAVSDLELGFTSVRLYVAEASYSDRSIKAQGVINPTMFNVYDRYMDRLYSMPSWTSRPRNIGLPSSHFSPLDDSTKITGELECNYYDGVEQHPYYQILDYGTEDERISDTVQNDDVYDYIHIIYAVTNWANAVLMAQYICEVRIAKIKLNGNSLEDLGEWYYENFVNSETLDGARYGDKYTDASGIEVEYISYQLEDDNSLKVEDRIDSIFSKLNYKLIIDENIPGRYLVGKSMFERMCKYNQVTLFGKKKTFFWASTTSKPEEDAMTSLYNALKTSEPIYTGDISGVDSSSVGFSQSYYKKQFMFVDENVITLDSPELTYESSFFDMNDGLKLRIIGCASVDSCVSDIFLDASKGKLAGENFVNNRYSGTERKDNLCGAIAYPMWQDYSLIAKDRETQEIIEGEENNEYVDRESLSNYLKDGPTVRYWIRMWQRSGAIDGWNDPDIILFDGNNYASIRRKTFGNLRYCNKTYYSDAKEYDLDSIRIFNYTASQNVRLFVGEDIKMYDGYIDTVVAPPANIRYPILYTKLSSSIDSDNPETENTLTSNEPIRLTFASNPHIVMSLPSDIDPISGKYMQTILPVLNGESGMELPERGKDTGALVPWIKENSKGNIKLVAWNHTIPEFVIDSWDKTKNKISIHCDLTSYGETDRKDYANLFASVFWDKAILDNYNSPVYVRLAARDSDESIVYLIVDISNYYLHHPDEEVGYDSIYINNADLAAYYKDGEDVFIPVSYVFYTYTIGGPGSSVTTDSSDPRFHAWENWDITKGNIDAVKKILHFASAGEAKTVFENTGNISYRIEGATRQDFEGVEVSYFDKEGSPQTRMHPAGENYDADLFQLSFGPGEVKFSVLLGEESTMTQVDLIIEGGGFTSTTIIKDDIHISYEITRKLNVATGETSNIGDSYKYVDYAVNQDVITVNGISPNTPYFLIGEIYRDYGSGIDDVRYGGISESAIQNNRFIPAGPQYLLSDTRTIYGNQGDTYFQRWNDLRIKPLGENDTNGVIDIVSVMLETHINLNGRTSLQQDSRYIASLKPESYDDINMVYSQRDNFFANQDLDSDFDLDTYRSSITWTLEKHDSAITDEWMHITLGSSLAFDGDKGWCVALRRFQDTILAFQPKGISQILFNSRTQIASTEGVPIEIANSGKVDGKSYITTKYGSTNKWSITEGKLGLYFVDNYNKAFCRFAGGDVENISTKLGFSSWFRGQNALLSWKPNTFYNFVSYYDKLDSEIYLLKDDPEYPCLVYNEILGGFTSFYSYDKVQMIASIEDELVAFKSGSLWKMHAGLYCNFFGKSYDFWTTYRVTPNPISDKTWTNLEYRSDFYNVLDASGDMLVDEQDLLREENYIPNETFDSFIAWNEYQTTNEFNPKKLSIDRYPDVRKKFRIWRLDIPRAKKDENNRTGLNRMRNPWLQFTLKKMNAGTGESAKQLAQIHDLTIKYFE